jgi:hypothetical protein
LSAAGFLALRSCGAGGGRAGCVAVAGRCGIGIGLPAAAGWQPPVGAAPRARAARRRTFRLAARAGRRGGVRVERIGGIG